MHLEAPGQTSIAVLVVHVQLAIVDPHPCCCNVIAVVR